ncbi:MAG: ArsR/SmtB family transcription factor [Paracoccus sp. (in: a-proteobacteria)]
MGKREALAALSALGQESRLDAVRLLVRAGGKGLAAGKICAQLGVVQNTLSNHLSILVQSGLIRSQREGRVIRYFANMEGLNALMSYLIEDCCGGQADCCAADTDRTAPRTDFCDGTARCRVGDGKGCCDDAALAKGQEAGSAEEEPRGCCC